MRVIKIDLNKDYSEAIREAIDILKLGGTIVYPTDTVYGLGCNALDEIAVRHIFDISHQRKFLCFVSCACPEQYSLDSS